MKMLITLDGSKFAEEVLGPAADLASRAGAEVHLLEVVRGSRAQPTWAMSSARERALRGEYDWPRGAPMALPEYPINMGVLVERAAQAEERTCGLAKDYLHSVSSRFFNDAANAEVMVGDDPAEEILAYVRREKVDLIAMATHGRTGLSKLLLGSVAAKLLRARAVPLFLVGPRKLHRWDG